MRIIPQGDRTRLELRLERIRDGGSFTTRRVKAIQHGRPIFAMSVSFHRREESFEHHSTMPDVPPPEDVPRLTFEQIDLTKAPPNVQRFVNISAPFEIRPIDPYIGEVPDAKPPLRRAWVRTVDALPDDYDMHRAILAYLSDYAAGT